MYVLQTHEAVVVLVEEGEGAPAVAVDQRLVGGAQQRGARHQVHRELVHAAHQVPPIITKPITIDITIIMTPTLSAGAEYRARHRWTGPGWRWCLHTLGRYCEDTGLELQANHRNGEVFTIYI